MQQGRAGKTVGLRGGGQCAREQDLGRREGRCLGGSRGEDYLIKNNTPMARLLILTPAPQTPVLVPLCHP